jgi:glycerol-3-phosphate dehydrogenase (NAD(P)+)
MGTVLGLLLCEKSITARMWGHDREQLLQIERDRENKKFLAGYSLSEELEFEPDDRHIMSGADLIVSAVPCQFARGVWNRLKKHVPEGVPIVSVTKGIENGTLLRPTQIMAEILRSGRDDKLAVLSGPTIADELARRLPATACVASRDQELSKQVQCALNGTGAGDNAKAALLTRGLAEITRLGTAMGARAQTFSGLTGLGDLVTTCISPTGRNRAFGERIGKGLTVEQAHDATESVVEGTATCKSVVALAKRYDVEMPITQAIYEVLFEDKPVQRAIADLMRRQLKAE